MKKYTHDKNIVEVIVDRENNVEVMEGYIFKLMEHALAFLKSANIIAPTTQARFVNKMTMLNLQDKVKQGCEAGQYSTEMISATFVRTGALISLIHAKTLLLTHGYDSFYEYITNYFDENAAKKKQSSSSFVKKLKQTQEYKDF